MSANLPAYRRVGAALTVTALAIGGASRGADLPLPPLPPPGVSANAGSPPAAGATGLALPPLPPPAPAPNPVVPPPVLIPAPAPAPELPPLPGAGGTEAAPGSAAGGEGSTPARDRVEPTPLRRPTGSDAPDETVPFPPRMPGVPFVTPTFPPLGYAGRTGIVPRAPQTDPHFVPVEDRWRIGFPEWDRYDKGHPVNDDYPYMPGRFLDPFNQTVLKGDYPIAGQHLFLDLVGGVLSFQEYRQIPTPTTPFESTKRPFEEQFFQRPNQFFSTNFFFLSFDLTHGDAAFKPADWKIRLVPTFNFNNLSVQELAIVSPNVLQGNSRTRTFWALQEAFFEMKLADTSTEYDFASVRVGNQPFISDFRGFLFVDTNAAVRIFGNRNGNRDQYNLAYFYQWEKDTNSQLNTFTSRRQNLVFANYYRQDFLFPGYTTQLSFAFNHDPAKFKFDRNRFLVRPDPVGLARPHELNVAYLGWAGDGHIGRFNLTHQFYWALGHDSLNPIANQAQQINAQMFAVEGSYDRDWARFRLSFFWSSGDQNPNNSHATGFDSILDAPVFAGGPFSYWNRQQIPLFGVNLVQRLSLVPDLRSSKFQGQSNFVNPGIYIPTVGVDFDLTPRLKMINNVNVLWFDSTKVLQQFLFDGNIGRFIGTDVSCGFEYKPLLSENVVFLLGTSALIPGQSFRDIYNNFNDRVGTLFGGFAFLSLTF